MITHNRRAALRRTETPNATMTTLGSPTQGSEHLSLWRVEMREGAEGPVHVFDSEQIWTVLDGEVEIKDGHGGAIRLAPGDAAVLAPDAERQVVSLRASELIVCGYGDAIAAVPGNDEMRTTPRWIA